MSKSDMKDELSGSEIAIIGMSCRFPGAKDVDSFWRNLRDGVESVSFLNDDELELSNIDPATLSDPNYVKAASIIDDVDLFDASFFGFSPREAQIMDPQQRLFLECSWEALENAGYNTETYEEMIGVFAGARTNTYLFNLFANRQSLASLGSFEIGLGNDLAFLSSRLSYKLNLRGPSFSVHTACSTALVAVHLACQSLLIDECQVALAGGVAINVPHKTGYLYQANGISSPDGHCRPFDADAQGTIFGSGVGLVVLKRLEDAIAHRDTIYAVIKGSAINNDGSPKASFTAPSVYGQTQVIKEALANSGVEAETIGYVEAHGTATPLGDPIEIRALTKAYRQSTKAQQFCAVGSVKSNFGHLDAAAGVAGLIKTVLALRHGQLPPTLHFRSPNPQIDFSASPFYVNSTLRDWPAAPSHPRRAAVSSFGVGGTNAHLVLEEAPVVTATSAATPAGRESRLLLLLSARTATALERMAKELAEHLLAHPEQELADVAYTLAVGRRRFAHRRAVVCRNRDEAVEALLGRLPKQVVSGEAVEGERQVVMMFPGGGAQYAGMCRGLYETESEFRLHVDACAEWLAPRLGCDIRDLLCAPAGELKEAGERLKSTGIGLPSLFVVEYALAQLLMKWGIRPAAMIGHSLGEYVAACLSGVFTLEEALRVVSERGRLFEELPSGAMLSVGAGEREVREVIGAEGLEDELSIAAVNAPGLCVVSGAVGAVERMGAALSEQEVEYRRLQINVAAHSRMVEGILERFGESLRGVEMGAPSVRFISNVTGSWVKDEEARSAQYWVRHLRETVRFGAGVEELLKEEGRVLLEVGPGQGLSALVRMNGGCANTADGGTTTSGVATTVVSMVRQAQEEWVEDEEQLLRGVGRMWVAGVEAEWEAVCGGEERGRVGLPSYPFERQRFWIDAAPQVAEAGGHRAGLGKRQNVAEWFYVPSWKPTIMPRLFDAARLTEQQRCWLILEDDSGLGAKVADRLERENLDVVRVRTGQQFSRDGEGSYRLNPGSAEDYEALLRELRAQQKLPGVLVHLWSITTEEEAETGGEAFRAAQEMGFYSLLSLARALKNLEWTEPLQLCIISNRLQEVESSDAAQPEKSTVLAACKVMPQEFDNVNSRCLDVVLPAPGTAQEQRLVAQLLAEMAMESPDIVVAYRGHRRWVQSFEPAPLAGDEEPVRPLRENGVYLITGGLGGVGLLLGEYLARTHRARLVLLGRSSFPAREEWETWLNENGEEDPVSRRMRKLLAMEAAGAELLIVSADVADEEQMRAVFDRTFEKYGALHGVLHAAGVTSGASVFNLMTEITPADAEEQFQPKAYGLYVLEKMLRGRDVDFCLLFSSNAAVLGGLGFAAYCASNLFMDAFASARSKNEGSVWISANWDAWPEETKKYTGFQTSMDQYTMTPEESVEAFRRAASMAPPGQVAVSTGDLQAKINMWLGSNSGAESVGVQVGSASAAAHPRPISQSIYAPPTNETEQTIAGIWQQMLGIERVGINDSFFDLGGHSLLATKVVGRLREAFRVDIPLNEFFKSPTVVGLARVVAGAQAGRAEQEQLEILQAITQLSEDELDVELQKRLSAP
jgi:acyl transferase domain-containing protein/acyl carrier protein